MAFIVVSLMQRGSRVGWDAGARVLYTEWGWTPRAEGWLTAHHSNEQGLAVQEGVGLQELRGTRLVMATSRDSPYRKGLGSKS